ncbi:MAG: hypothetical protein WAK94_16110 [Steroidobacteraceae bacterium]
MSAEVLNVVSSKSVVCNPVIHVPKECVGLENVKVAVSVDIPRN